VVTLSELDGTTHTNNDLTAGNSVPSNTKIKQSTPGTKQQSTHDVQHRRLTI
jgi:hypothetical protein